MDTEESNLVARVVADSSSSLLVQALEESNELLGDENKWLREECERLRYNNRTLRNALHAVRTKSTELFAQIDELGEHIFLAASEELADSEEANLG